MKEMVCIALKPEEEIKETNRAPLNQYTQKGKMESIIR